MSAAERVAAWIGDRAIAFPLSPSDPATARLDLLGPLGPTADDSAVVALGASTRGSRELTLATHTALRILITRHGVRAVAIEGTEGTAADLDRYVTTGRGDPEAVLLGSRSFLRTREALDILRWLRAFARGHPDDPVRVVHDLHVRPAARSLPRIERRLAERNLAWLESTGQRVAQWGGVAHTIVGMPRTVSPADRPQTHRNAGGHQHAVLGARYVSIAVTLTAGTARGAGRIPTTPPGFAEHPLARLDRPVSYLPLRSPGPVPPEVAAWLTAPLRMRCIGPVYDPHHDPDHYVGAGSLTTAVDALLHVHHLTPATNLPD